MTGVMGIFLVRSVGFSAVRGVGKKLRTIWRYGCLSVQGLVKSEPGGTCVPNSAVALECLDSVIYQTRVRILAS